MDKSWKVGQKSTSWKKIDKVDKNVKLDKIEKLDKNEKLDKIELDKTGQIENGTKLKIVNKKCIKKGAKKTFLMDFQTLLFQIFCDE